MAHCIGIARPGKLSCMHTGEPELAEQSLSSCLPHAVLEASAAAGCSVLLPSCSSSLQNLLHPAKVLASEKSGDWLQAVWPPRQVLRLALCDPSP